MKYVVVICIFREIPVFTIVLGYISIFRFCANPGTYLYHYTNTYTIICVFAFYSQYLWGKDLKNSSNPPEKSSLYYQGLRSAPLLCGFSNGLERSGSCTFGQRRCKRDRQCFCWDLILGLLTVYVYIYNNNPSKPRMIYH